MSEPSVPETGRRRLLLGAGGAAVALLAAACSSGKTTSPATTTSPTTSPTRSPTTSPSPTGSASPSPSGTAAAASVTIKNFAFNPSSLTVAPGTRITVTNQDSVDHTFTASAAGGFDTGPIAGGASAVVTAPSQPGSYPFMCTIHPYIKGTLTVG
jgi:plastocyanin